MHNNTWMLYQLSVVVDDTSHLAATLLQETPAPWYMTNSIPVLEDGYSEVVVNVMALALMWQLFSPMKGRPRMMSTNSTGDRCTFVTVNMNLGGVIIVCVYSKTF